MASSRLMMRSSRALFSATRPSRPFTALAPLRNDDFSHLNSRANDTAEEYRRRMTQRPANPHMTNTTSTIANEMPTLGKDAPPPEMLTAVDPQFTPKDAVPENTEHMTGGTQSSRDQDVSGANKELGVGELEGAKFRVEPIRREGEDAATMRARLLYQSRKRGTLESDLLLSTFADANLASMTHTQLRQYDMFLDENDWDIYYWATQEPSPTSTETAEGSGSDLASSAAQGNENQQVQQKDEWKRAPAKGEWAQTVGTFKPAYRPVPQRWRDSEILGLLRRHVKARSAGGVGESEKEVEGKGLGMMPEIKNFES